MAYDDRLAERVRIALSEHGDFEERKMFGGLAFLLGGHMCCGVVGDELMLRVGPDRYQDVLSRPHVREMDFTGRPLTGMVYVGKPGLQRAASLRGWIGAAAAFVRELPPKRVSRPKQLTGRKGSR